MADPGAGRMPAASASAAAVAAFVAVAVGAASAAEVKAFGYAAAAIAVVEVEPVAEAAAGAVFAAADEPNAVQHQTRVGRKKHFAGIKNPRDENKISPCQTRQQHGKQKLAVRIRILKANKNTSKFFSESNRSSFCTTV